jgi:thiamine-monophosphate kinase
VTAEFELLAALQANLDGDGPGVPRGVGDDAAVVEIDGPVVATVDTLIEGVHVDRRWSSPADIGFKALSVNVSDLAAMGALPVAALVSLQLPHGTGREEVLELYDGLREAASTWRCRLVGGDTVTSPTLAVSVTALGALQDPSTTLRRDTAEPGQLVVVVGGLGLSAAGLEVLARGDVPLRRAHREVVAAHRRPLALPEAVPALVMAGVAAAIDVSDGLGRDLGHLAAASDVGIRLVGERLPMAPAVLAAAQQLGLDVQELVLGGGEDLALAVTVDPHRLGRLDVALEAVGLRARVVGEVVRGSGVEVDGRDVTSLGYEHQ